MLLFKGQPVINKEYIEENYPCLKDRINCELMDELLCFYVFTTENKFNYENENSVPIARNFQKKHNIAYLGELIERAEEREIIKSQKDLFTFVFTISNLIHFEKSRDEANALKNLSIFENQNAVYENFVMDKLEIKFDPLTALHLMASISNERKEKLKDLIFLNLEQINDFHDLALTAHSCFSIPNLNHFDEEEHHKMLYIITNNLINIVKEIQFDMSQDSKYLFLVARFLQLVLDNEAYNFNKIRGIKTQIKAFINLITKEVTENEIKKVSSFLNIPYEEACYLNYKFTLIASGYSGYIQNITAPGYRRIKMRFLKNYFNKNEEVPGFVKKSMELSSRGFIEDMVQNVVIKNAQNFKFIFSIYNNPPLICFTKTHRYILDDVEKIDAMDNANLCYLIGHFLKTTNDREFAINLCELANKKSLDIHDEYCFEQFASVVKNLIDLNIIDIYDYTNINPKYFASIAQYIDVNFSTSQIVSYLLDCSKHLDIRNWDDNLINYFLDFDPEETNLPMLKEFYELQEEIYFIFRPKRYIEYIKNKLLNNSYIKVMEIDEETKKNLLNKMMHLVSNREEIKKVVLSKEEREKEEKERIIDEIKNENNLLSLYHRINYNIKNENFSNCPEANRTIFERAMNIIESGNSIFNGKEYIFSILSYLVNKNAITQQELWGCFKKDSKCEQKEGGE